MKTMMYRSVLKRLAGVAIVAAMLMTVPAAAQQPDGAAVLFKAGVVQDLDNLSEKYVGLAQAMEGKYDWRPGEGVRSVGEVFNLIVMENKMLANVLSAVAPQQGSRPAPITDMSQLQEALRSSYGSLKERIAALPEGELSAPVTFFGRQTTKQGALFMMLLDQHEHLGQSIAYARTNNVTPPWSVKQQ